MMNQPLLPGEQLVEETLKHSSTNHQLETEIASFQETNTQPNPILMPTTDGCQVHSQITLSLISNNSNSCLAWMETE
jgi:hypothetical protein